MVLPGWALTIAEARLSTRHLQRAIVNARVTGPRDAVDVGFLDEVVAADALLDAAVTRAADLAATLDPAAYRATVRKFRGPVLDTMATQIAADRATGVAVSA
jgi:enoyl-CoA hydratase/carnithine racemase